MTQITVLSRFGKLFTSVINDRIHSFLETSDILGNEQSGFRKGHSTMDHVFGKKELFCAFIDYKKALDNVQRGLLWKTVKFWCEWEGSTCDTK